VGAPVSAVVATRSLLARGAGVRSLLARWVVLAGLIALWELLTKRAENPYFPPPSAIAEAIRDRWFSGPASQLYLSHAVREDIVPSLSRLLTGWAIAAVLGVGIGLALGRSEWLHDYVAPVLHFLRAVPPPALLPVFVVLLGLDNTMQLTVIVFGVIWPVILNTADGARSVPPTQVDTARVFQTSRTRWLLTVVLPSAAPKVFAGLRISLSLSLILMVISEFIGSSHGLGRTMVDAQYDFALRRMWAVVVLLGVLGYLLNSALLAVERRVLRWHSGARGALTDA
jgi:ABC-type nitrate/sulfonate/bicarbonate transport system permease component